jgi:hypothetical protein
MGFPLGPMLYWKKGGLGISATIVGGGRLSVRWSRPGGFLPWRKVFCLLKVVGDTVWSLSGDVKSDSSTAGLVIMEEAKIWSVVKTGPSGADVGAYVEGTMAPEIGVGVCV